MRKAGATDDGAGSAVPSRPGMSPWRMLVWGVRGLLLVAVTGVVALFGCIVWMPGEKFRGPLPPLAAAEADLADELRRDVVRLAGEIGERNIYRPQAYATAAAYVERELEAAGYTVERQTFEVARVLCCNLIVERTGTATPEEILVVGAHYDSVYGCPAANDNGSAVAALLALARRFAERETGKTLRFVAFANEEPPHFQTEDMGSFQYARRCRLRDEPIAGMISLETIGYYSDEQGSQHYPPPLSWFYPSQGNFIAFVGNMKSRRFIHQVIRSFRTHAQFPSEGGALPGFVSEGGFSDHWSFWQFDYPALMVTDTAMFRYPYYHTREDTPDKLDHERTARVVAGLERMLAELTTATR